MVHPAALAISFGVVLGSAIFALFYLSNSRNSQSNHYTYERPQADSIELIQSQLAADTCSICLDKFSNNDDIFLECMHRFHNNCIQQSMRHSKLCPNCRQPAKIYHS